MEAMILAGALAPLFLLAFAIALFMAVGLFLGRGR